MYSSIWNWEKVENAIRTLSGRLGFAKGDILRFMGLRLNLKNGQLYDEYLLKDRSDIAPNIYFILYRYSYAQEKPEAGQLITFRQIYGGDLYYKTYSNIVLKSLHQVFSDDPDLLIETCKLLGGIEISIKDYDTSLKVYVLPLIPIYIAINFGDEEFPSSFNVFYDESIKNYFTAEETSHLSEFFVNRLIEISRELKI